jgi:hypothetical protein
MLNGQPSRLHLEAADLNHARCAALACGDQGQVAIVRETTAPKPRLYNLRDAALLLGEATRATMLRFLIDGRLVRLRLPDLRKILITRDSLEQLQHELLSATRHLNLKSNFRP